MKYLHRYLVGVHPGVDSSTEEICCGVVRHNGAARRELGLGVQSAQENPEGLDDGLHVARHDDGGGFDLGGFRANAWTRARRSW